LNVRRVVTGHDEHGRAIVAIDELCSNIISRRAQHASCVIWSSGTFPADNADPQDGATRELGTTDPGGTVFRVVQLDARECTCVQATCWCSGARCTTG
jgi:hypothetical protein